MAIPDVLVLGAAGVGKSSLIASVATSCPGHSHDGAGRTTTWRIRNKYYEASVQLVEALASPGVPSDVTPEALLLVFRADRQASFLEVQQALLEEQRERIDVKAVVATHIDSVLDAPGTSSSSSVSLDHVMPEWLQHAVAWSYEHGFEFIACCPAAPSLDEQLTFEGDRQGVHRVVQVLHAHTWPNLERAGPQRGPDARSEHATPGPASTPSSTGPVTTTPPSGTGEQLTDPNSSANGAGHPPVAAAAAATAPPPHGHGPANAGSSDDGGGDDSEQEEAETFDKMFQEMQGMKARIASLPDEERREQAAAFALHMLAAMGIEDSDEDGDDDAGSSSSHGNQ